MNSSYGSSSSAGGRGGSSSSSSYGTISSSAASQHARVSKLKISAQDLMCKNNCGHFGNEVQEGYCSVCYKLYKQQQHLRQQQYAAAAAAASSSSPRDDSFNIFGRSGISSGFATIPKAAKLSFDTLSSPLSGFAKFEEKKRHQAGHKSKSFRSVFQKKSPTPSPSKSPELIGKRDRTGSTSSTTSSHLGSASSPKMSPHRPPQDSEKEQIRNEINTFLLTFSKQIVHDVVVKVKQCESELTRACRASNMTVEEISDIAQDFYRNFKGKVDMVPAYQSMTAEDKETLMDLIEKYLTISLYKELFSPINTTTDDEDKDLMLQNRIRSLNWITCKHLDVLLNERDQQVRDYVFQAINAIIGMDSVKPPQEKLACITQCSHRILEALGMSKQAPTSADDFLPTLIYIVIKANPTRLHSNINFITRFCNASRLMSGESGYFFTNLCCVVSFIQNMKGESLSMTEEEFNDYVSGKSIPSESWDNYFSESLHSMEEMSNELTEMKTRHDAFLQNVDTLRKSMQQKQEWISKQVDVILKRTPLTFKPRKIPTNIDEELSQPSLPLPLQPEVVNKLVGKEVPTQVSDVKVDANTNCDNGGDHEISTENHPNETTSASCESEPEVTQRLPQAEKEIDQPQFSSQVSLTDDTFLSAEETSELEESTEKTVQDEKKIENQTTNLVNHE